MAHAPQFLKLVNESKKKVKETKDKVKKWWEKRNSPEAKQKRLDKAIAGIRPSATFTPWARRCRKFAMTF